MELTLHYRGRKTKNMKCYSILLVEDTDDDAKNCTDSVDIMNEENADISIMIDVTKTVGEAIEKLKLNNYHGAIIDIKIDDGTDKSGNDVIKDIISTYRLPVAVMTATPGFKADEETNIPIYIKGEAKYKEIINELIEIDNTGLFDVLGGKGIIEKKMVSVFWNNIYPQLDTWRKYSTEGIDTESILLRYILAHLLEGLSEEGTAYCTEETYISLKGMENRLHTGDIFLHKDKCEYYILLSPPCDLALHDGKPKTETLMLCAIEAVPTGLGKSKLSEIVKNKKEFYHWLPDNSMFDGGIINFRRVVTVSSDKFFDKFDSRGIKVQDTFVKNIMNRFSAYYARQGQPDFAFDKEIENRINNK